MACIPCPVLRVEISIGSFGEILDHLTYSRFGDFRHLLSDSLDHSRARQIRWFFGRQYGSGGLVYMVGGSGSVDRLNPVKLTLFGGDIRWWSWSKGTAANRCSSQNRG